MSSLAHMSDGTFSHVAAPRFMTNVEIHVHIQTVVINLVSIYKIYNGPLSTHQGR